MRSTINEDSDKFLNGIQEIHVIFPLLYRLSAPQQSPPQFQLQEVHALDERPQDHVALERLFARRVLLDKVHRARVSDEVGDGDGAWRGWCG